MHHFCFVCSFGSHGFSLVFLVPFFKCSCSQSDVELSIGKWNLVNVTIYHYD